MGIWFCCLSHFLMWTSCDWNPKARERTRIVPVSSGSSLIFSRPRVFLQTALLLTTKYTVLWQGGSVTNRAITSSKYYLLTLMWSLSDKVICPGACWQPSPGSSWPPFPHHPSSSILHWWSPQTRAESWKLHWTFLWHVTHATSDMWYVTLVTFVPCHL